MRPRGPGNCSWPAVAALSLAAHVAAEPVDCRKAPWPVHVRVGLDGPMVLAGGGPRSGNDSAGMHAPLPCRVLWLGHREASEPLIEEAALELFDHVLTDSLEKVRFASRAGRLHFLERTGELFLPPDPDTTLMSKEHMLSVLLPSEDSAAWDDPLTHEIQRQALAFMPEHTFVDDRSLDVHVRAFAPYRFSLIADDENHTVSQAFVRCIGLQAVPLFNGFSSLGAMTLRAIVPYNRTHFGLELLRATLQDINHDIGWLWNYHRMLQDQLLYRYAQPFEDRLFAAACTLCGLGRRVPTKSAAGSTFEGGGVAPLASVAVFSAGMNYHRRQTIRETWGRVLREVYRLRVRFFLGNQLAPETNPVDRMRIIQEMEANDDLVLLDVQEGYKMNSRKGLLLLEWCARHVEAEFLLKVDDDVYLRPAPVLAVLQKRTPFGYVWGYFDYLSPVPRESGDPFSADEEAFPYAAFPPYPRGVVRALSMDVVRRVAAAGRKGRLRMVAGDDPCLGVHLRQLVLDPEDPIPILELDDRDSYRAFAMEPSCSARLWSHVTPRTWAAHHVTAEQMRCMWTADVVAGYYTFERGEVALSPAGAAAAGVAADVATAPQGAAPVVPALPDACECLLEGPLAEALANRSDKINASRTYEIWGDPNAEPE